MNLLVMLLTIWRWRTSLSQTMIMKPVEISTSKILRTIKAQTITACWVECQQTTECETIGTDPEDKKTNGFVSDCYLFGSHENKTDASDETPLKVTEISPFPEWDRKITMEANETCTEETSHSNTFLQSCRAKWRETSARNSFKEFEWYLGMNLYPDDGHIMDFLTGWDDENDIGNTDTAFTKDYLNQKVWRMPVNRIAIVRHQEGDIDAVKVWKFKKGGRSMLNRFKDIDPVFLTGRYIVQYAHRFSDSCNYCDVGEKKP